MKEQKDWFTGIDYYNNYKEKEIQVEKLEISKTIDLHAHVQVELWYVLDGIAKMDVNGKTYPLEKNAFLCLYAHHLYQVYEIKESLKVIRIRFFIGLFMHMMWEKHESATHAQLVYETKPIIDGNCDKHIKELFLSICKEQEEEKFGARNMIVYRVLELHTLYCRYALEDTRKVDEKDIWYIIQQILVSPAKSYKIDEAANKLGYHPNYLNQKLKQLCGMTFLELKQFAKVLNVCALLHFEELEISYIIEQLGDCSKATFYRIFEEYTGMSPTTYQKKMILDQEHYYHGQDRFLKILQYLSFYFTGNITIQDCAQELNIKEYAIEQLLKDYDLTFKTLLEDIRFLYAKTLIETTDIPLTTIAMDCGFGSLSTFQRVFQNKRNCMPSEYRKKIKTLKNENN